MEPLVMAGQVAGMQGVIFMSTEPFIVIPSRQKQMFLGLLNEQGSAIDLAIKRLCMILREECGSDLVIQHGFNDGQPRQVIGMYGGTWDPAAPEWLRQAGLEIDGDGRLMNLSQKDQGRADQGFVVKRLVHNGCALLLLAANNALGMKNALLTLSDRLYRDAEGNLVADPFDGVHVPAFMERHIKTDAMNAGRFRAGYEYWDCASTNGINEFADWLASFRITDYNLLAFMRGWGTTYISPRFPALADTQHPNVKHDFYSRMIDRFHDWGVKVWAADIYVGSGYSMEVGTCPEMLSPVVDGRRLKPFRAGEGSFAEVLTEPDAIACLSHPAAARYYSDIVLDLLERYPRLDGLDFHLGHMFPHKICRCSQCRGYQGNREALYQCFRHVYQTAVGQKPDIRLKAAVKMFGDATREIVEHYDQFPRLEFFCWLRWIGNLWMDQPDAPVTIGNEDGGGGLEANNYSQPRTLVSIRRYYRDYEPWLWNYTQLARKAGLPSISWEPQLHREIEQMFFVYSQLTWEPDLSWADLARRYVLRSKRRCDDKLISAYALALEMNAAITSYGMVPWETVCGRVLQQKALLGVSDIREKTAALDDLLGSMGIAGRFHQEPPVFFDLEWSLSKTLARFLKGETLEPKH